MLNFYMETNCCLDFLRLGLQGIISLNGDKILFDALNKIVDYLVDKKSVLIKRNRNLLSCKSIIS